MNATPGSPSPEQSLAETLVRQLLERDPVSTHLGMQLTSVTPGQVHLTMAVRADMLSGLGICHGGIVFTLANSALALACNSRNHRTLNLTSTIHFTHPVQAGDTLVVLAEEKQLNHRTGVYDMTVTNQHDETVALFRGTTYRTKDSVLKP